MSSIGSNQSSKRWELVSIAECESSGLLVTFFMAWSPGRRLNAGDSRLITTETTPPSIPTNPATGPMLTLPSRVPKILSPSFPYLLTVQMRDGPKHEPFQDIFLVGFPETACAILVEYSRLELLPGFVDLYCDIQTF